MKNFKDNRQTLIPKQTDRLKVDTQLTHMGRRTKDDFGMINMPVYHASTVSFPSAKALRERDAAYTYGLNGTPTTDALCQSLTALEGAAGTCLQPSGLASILSPLMAILKAGDHLLITDSIYQPTRIMASELLEKFNIEVEYYDPLIAGDISLRFKPNTRAVFMEAPGSQTFEMQDVPAIVKACQAAGVITMIDNTYASPLFFKPISIGVDISINAGTKYLAGHSDVMLGYVSANEALWPQIKLMNYVLGQTAGPDDVFLALRGMRTMGLRMRHHMESGLKIAKWLEAREEVDFVLHPGLESHPQHEIWARDFKGANGLFTFVLKPSSLEASDAFIDHLELFSMGFSWGGFESLMTPFDPRTYRTATQWNAQGQAMRVHIGLEDTDDLIADLSKGFDRFNALR